MSGLKYNQLNDELTEYVLRQRTGAEDSLLTELAAETLARFPDDAEMQVSGVQGSFLTILVQLMGVTNALEIGTFTGCSSICIARGLPADGRLVCLDMDEQWTGLAREYWEKAGLVDRIELILGDALQTISQLSSTTFGLVHIDAEKTIYDDCFEAALPLLKSNGLIVFDNMLWGGRVVEDSTDERTAAIQALNDKLVSDPRVETVLLPIGDGIQFCSKR